MNLERLPESCFPASDVVNKLASLRAKGLKAKVQAPFPLVDLAEFQPSWCLDSPAEAGETKKGGKLDMVRWMAAFQAYAVAADAAEVCLLLRRAPLRWDLFAIVVLQVWKYSSAIAHLNVCLEIAAGAAAEKERFSLAIIYDEICCSEWNLKATRGPKLFSLAQQSHVFVRRLCACR